MGSIAEGVRAGRARSRRVARPQLLGGGVLWIVLFAALLSGVVAVNVTVLRLNLELDGIGRERSELRSDIANLRSELSSASATARIERVATTELGLTQADPETTIYVRLRK
ncbi:MAG: cell division protein FtsL [Actinomycetota bacterium]|nr:cell division protein FtsL [Actinomycetota bacterium]